MKLHFAFFIDIQTDSLMNITKGSEFLKHNKQEYKSFQKNKIPCICTYMQYDTPSIGKTTELYPKEYGNFFSGYPHLEKQFMNKNIFIAGLYKSHSIFLTANYAKEQLNCKLFSKEHVLADINPNLFAHHNNKVQTKIDKEATLWLAKNIQYI